MTSITSPLGPQWAEAIAIRTADGSESTWNACDFIAIRADQTKDQSYGSQHDHVILNDIRSLKAFRLSSKTPWDIKTSVQQWATLMTRFIANIVEEKKRRNDASPNEVVSPSAQPWSTLAAEDAEEWWGSHLTSDAVRVAAIAFLQNVPAALEASPKKADLVAALVAHKVPPCPPYVLGLLYTGMQGRSTPPSQPPQVLVTAPAGSTQASFRVPYVVTPPSSPDRIPNSADTAIAQLASLLRDAAAAMSPQKAAKEAVPLDQFSAWQKRVHARIKAHQYVDPALLAPENIRKKREKLQGRLQTDLKTMSMGVDGTIVVTPEESLNAPEGCTSREFQAGFDYLLAVLAKDQATAGRVPDMLAWKNAVTSYEGLSLDGHTLYMRDFMYKYQGPDHAKEWESKFETDVNLLMAVIKKEAMLIKASESAKAPIDNRRRPRENDGQNEDRRNRPRFDRQRNSAQARPREQPRKQNRARSPRRRSTSPQRQTRRRSTSPQRQIQSSKMCKSRMFSKTACKFGAKCRFSHVCPCCNTDHPDADATCTKWDAVKIKKMIEDLHLKP